MTVTDARLAEILQAERELVGDDWLRYFDSLTQEEQTAYYMADSGQPRG
jgi:hypothetical protein